MTLRDLIQAAGNHPAPIVTTLAALPALAWLVGVCHRQGEGRNAPWKYAYSVLVYLTCIPGTFAGVPISKVFPGIWCVVTSASTASRPA